MLVFSTQHVFDDSAFLSCIKSCFRLVLCSKVSNVTSSSRNLDLSKFCIGQKDEMQQPPIYDLYAVINHYGGMIGGHYTAYARLPSDKNSQRSDVGQYAVVQLYSRL